MGACLSCCFESKKEENKPTLVHFSPFKGPEVKASNFTVSGKGTILANAPLLQTRAYWDCKLITKGEFFLGVARKGTHDLDKQLGERKNSWSFHSGPGGGDFKVGDVIGCSYDLSQVKSVLEFYLNGEKLESATIRDVKGDVFPAVSVVQPCMIEANFGQAPWAYKPPANFDAVIFSRDML